MERWKDLAILNVDGCTKLKSPPLAVAQAGLPTIWAWQKKRGEG